MTFPAYSAYKDSGVEWLGKTPEHWKVAPAKRGISLLTDFTANGSFAALAENVEYQSSGYARLIRMTDLRQNLETDGIWIDESAYKYLEKSSLVGGELLMASVGSVGLIYLMPEVEYPASLAPNMYLLKTNSTLLSKFLYWTLLSEGGQSQIAQVATTTAQPKLNKDNVRSIVIALPEIQEQTQIARFLDHETARIDALIEEQQRLIELLKEKRQAVIFHAVTKGLDPTVPLKDSGVEWLGEVPAHWVRKRLKNISPFITVGIVVNPSDYVADEGLPFLYGGEVKEGFIEVDKARRITPENSRKNRKTMLETGDIVTMRVGYPGLTAVVPPECAGGNCASVMLVKRGSYDSHWLCAVMNSRLVRQQVEVVQYGAAQKQFNISDAIEFWMFEPPIEEQTMIAEFISEQSSVFNTLMDESESSILLLNERRSALISAAVTGKIDVRGWQPPASTQAPKLEVAEAN